MIVQIVVSRILRKHGIIITGVVKFTMYRILSSEKAYINEFVLASG